MCKNYRDKLNLPVTKDEEKVIEYYNSILDKKIICLNKILRYKKYLSFKGIGKRKLKEIMMFHFPILSYIVFIIK